MPYIIDKNGKRFTCWKCGKVHKPCPTRKRNIPDANKFYREARAFQEEIAQRRAI